MNIEEASGKLDEATKAVANRAFQASQLCDDWPDTLKLAALDSELGEVPSWPAAKRDAMLAVLERAALLGGDHGVEVTAEYHALRREIEEQR